MKEIKKIDALSTGKILAILSGIWALIMLVLDAILFYAAPVQFTPGTTISVVLSSGLILFVVMVVLGFIAGTLSSIFYNLVAKKLGGIKIMLD